MIWQIKYYHAKIAMLNLFLMKANRLSTRKRDSITNHRDVLTAEEQESSRGAITTEAAEEASVTDGKYKESICSPLYFMSHFPKGNPAKIFWL